MALKVCYGCVSVCCCCCCCYRLYISLCLSLAFLHRKWFDQPIKFNAERFYNTRCVMAVSRFVVVVVVIVIVIDHTFLFVYPLPLFTENGLSSQPTRSDSNGPKEGVLWLSLSLSLQSLLSSNCHCCCYRVYLSLSYISCLFSQKMV